MKNVGIILTSCCNIRFTKYCGYWSVIWSSAFSLLYWKGE